MATQTFEYASFGNGAVRVEYDINDANWRVSKVRCINNSDQDAIAKVYELGELVFNAVGLANDTTSWNVSGIQLAWQPDYWNDDTQEWEPAGIEMGDYVLVAQWPAEAQ